MFNCSFKSFFRQRPAVVKGLMIISPKAFIGSLPQICLDGHSVAVITETKCLGPTIDDKMNWGTHISQLVKKLSTNLKKLYQMRSLPSLLNNIVYLQGILPSATYYGLSIWGNGSKMRIEKLEDTGRLPDSSICHHIKKKIVPDDEVLQIAEWNSIDWMYKPHCYPMVSR